MPSAHAYAHEHGSVARADAQPFAAALVAACSYVAHADGELHEKERRRIGIILASSPLLTPSVASFALGDAARRAHAFARDPRAARRDALKSLELLSLSDEEARALISACQQVLEADGVCRQSEYQALAEIGQALR